MRESLSAINELSLNVIAQRGVQDAFGFLAKDFTLVPNKPDILRLYRNHIEIFSHNPNDKKYTNEIVYRDWYGLDDYGNGQTYLSNSDHYRLATGLTFEQLRQLVGDDVNVSDESGESYHNIYAQFFNVGWVVHLEPNTSMRKPDGSIDLFYDILGEDPSIAASQNQAKLPPLPINVHAMQNKCIRLQKRTGLPFHELGWLLMTSLYTHPHYKLENENIYEEVLADETSALNVLAHYVEWNSKYNLTVDQFAAMLADINCYRRQGSEDKTLMEDLFGSVAPVVTESTRRYKRKVNRKVKDIELEGFGDLLRRGFKVSSLEWYFLLNSVTVTKDDVLDSLMMGRIYRLVTLFRTFSWDLIDGLSLLGAVDSKLLATLSTSNCQTEVLTALDRVSWLAEWMKEHELLVSDVFKIMTPFPVIKNPNQKILNWVLGFQTALEAVGVTESDFTPFTNWEVYKPKSDGDSDSSDSEPEPDRQNWGLFDWYNTSNNVEEHGSDSEPEHNSNDDSDSLQQVTYKEDWVRYLQLKNVIDKNGFMLVEREELQKFVLRFLYKQGVEMKLWKNQEQVANLVEALMAKRSEQEKAVYTELANLSDGIDDSAVKPLLSWVGNTYVEAAQKFLHWNVEKEPVNIGGLNYLHHLTRYLIVVEKFEMQAAEIQWVSSKPQQLSTGMTKELTLRLVYLLSRFRRMQSETSTASDWFAYFDGLAEQTVEQSYAALAELTGANIKELQSLSTADQIGLSGTVCNVEQADYVIRRLEICEDASVSAGELLLFEKLISGNDSWAAAAGAAKTALSRFQDGKFERDVIGVIDEEKRDALVGAFMDNIVKPHEKLSKVITNLEDLYQYFLLDVNVSHKVPTTRLLENIGTLQLFIERVIQKREPNERGVNASDVFTLMGLGLEEMSENWTYMKQYRVWEAAEKLNTYPGNYVEPELRADKTPSFETLSSTLSSEIAPAKVEAALMTYLDDVQRLSELEASGFFYSPVPDEIDGTITYYFTARANWESNGYYVRSLKIDRDLLFKDEIDGIKLSDIDSDERARVAMIWTNWNKIDIAISSEIVYAVLPVYLAGRLYIMWIEGSKGMYKEKEEDENKEIIYLKLKAARRNLDGSFTQPWEPIVQISDEVSENHYFAKNLELNGLTQQTLRLMFDSNAEEWIKPRILQPTLENEGREAALYFSLSGAEKEAQFRWAITTSTTDMVVKFHSNDSFPSNEEKDISPYFALAHASYSLPPFQYDFEETNGFANSITFKHNSAELKVDFNIPIALYNEDGTSGIRAEVSEFSVTTTLQTRDLDNILVLEEITFLSPRNLLTKFFAGFSFWTNDKITVYKLGETDMKKYYEQGYVENNKFESNFSLERKLTVGDFSQPINPNSAKNGAMEFYFIFTVKKLSKSNGTEVLDEEGTVVDHYPSFSYPSDDSEKFVQSKPSTWRFANSQRIESYLYRKLKDIEGIDQSGFLLADENIERPRFLVTIDKDYGNSAVSLYSSAIGKMATVPITGDSVRNLFQNTNLQSETEDGVADFLEAVNKKYPLNYQSEAKLDFYGPFGIYAWELYFYIPLFIAAKYRQNGDYENARLWLQVVYNPISEQVWKTQPLVDPKPLTPLLADRIRTVDPDIMCRSDPIHYQMAVLRYYLETLIEEGDTSYRLETTESLRYAKSIYVSAEALFLSEEANLLEVSNREEWGNPELGSDVKEMDFRPLLNEVLSGLYVTIRKRLSNLRNWLSISGEPLNISLIAPPIDPRLLNSAGTSDLAALSAGSQNNVSLPFGFDVALAKAKEAVKNFMYFGDLLTEGMRRKDEQKIQELQAKLDDYVVDQFEVGGQKSVLKLLQMEKKVLEYDLAEAKVYKENYETFADEVMNGWEISGTAFISSSLTIDVAKIPLRPVKAALQQIPKIYGFSNGNAKIEGLAEQAIDLFEDNAGIQEKLSEIMFTRGEFERRKDENKMEAKAASEVVKSIEANLDRLQVEYEEELGTLQVLQEKSRQTRMLYEFQKKRSTNADFFNWYVSRIGTLYSSAFDVTVKFCRMAERAFQDEVGDPTLVFVKPVFATKYRGLLSGQSLMLDLQRMELAHAERGSSNANEGSRSISLREINPRQLDALKSTGRAMFTVREKELDKDAPDEFERRIKSMNIRLPGASKSGQSVAGKLSLVNHRVYHDRTKSKKRSSGRHRRQQIALRGIETSTESLATSESQFRPFERCGVESTWMLSFPGAIDEKSRKVKADKSSFMEALDDVVLDMTYTCKM